jgi:hypothetical protein
MHVTPQQRWDHLIRCRVEVAGLLGVQCGEVGRWVSRRVSPCPSGPISAHPFRHAAVIGTDTIETLLKH